MKLIILSLALFVSLPLSAQNQYGTIGRNFNSMMEWNQAGNPRLANFSPGGGGCLGYFREKIKNGKVSSRYGIDLNYFTGSYHLPGSSIGHTDVKKVTLGLNYYPLNFQVTPNFQLNFGARVSARLLDHSSEHFFIAQSGYSSTLQEYGGETRFFGAGLLARAAFKIPIGKRFYITPESVLLMGLTKEYKSTNSQSRLFQHQINIGFKL